MGEYLTRGKLAKATSINIETIRYYERIGLIQIAMRNRSNYRLFSPDTVQRIHFIQNAKYLGFTLKEIKELLKLEVKSKNQCRTVKAKVEGKIKQIEEKIESLNRMRKSLKSLSRTCDQGSLTGDCPILDSLSS